MTITGRRWCARWAWTLFLVVGACQPPPVQAGIPDKVPTVGIGLVAAVGDTLVYTVSWAAAPRATSYDFTVGVNATNGTWSALFGASGPFGLPASGNTQSVATTFSLRLTAIPWDSATFTVTVTPRNTKGPGSSASANWTVRRSVGVIPGPVTVDSSKAIALFPVARVVVRPVAVSLPSGSTRQLCAFWVLTDSSRGMFQWSKRVGAPDSVRMDTSTVCQAGFAAWLAERPA